MAKKKPEIWWVAKNTHGNLQPFTASRQRKGAIQNLIEIWLDPKPTWEKLRKGGFSVVKIQVREL